jgi:kynurenine formamidase
MPETLIVDLSLPMAPNDPHRPITFEPLWTMGREGYRVTRVTLDTHWGTHLDAPAHMLADAPTVDQVPLARFIGPASVVPLAPLPERHRITPQDLAPHAALATAGSRLLLHTGWAARYGQPDYTRAYPVIGVEAARWLAERQVWVVGTDTPSVGPAYDADRTELIAVHQVLLGAGVTTMENLTNLDRIPGGRCTLVALPLPFRGMDGSPVRAVALCEGPVGDRA